MNQRSIFIILLAFLAWSPTSQAQDTPSDCDQAVLQARAHFRAGKLHLIPPLLRNCQNFSSEALRVECFQLLSQTYFHLYDLEKAEAAYLGLLKQRPFHVSSGELVHKDFLSFTDQFTVSEQQLALTFGRHFFRVFASKDYFTKDAIRGKRETIIEQGLGSLDLSYNFQLGRSPLMLGLQIGADFMQYEFQGTYFRELLVDAGEQQFVSSSGIYPWFRGGLMLRFQHPTGPQEGMSEIVRFLRGFYAGAEFYYLPVSTIAPIHQAIEQRIALDVNNQDFFMHKGQNHWLRNDFFWAPTIGYQLGIPFGEKHWQLVVDTRLNLWTNSFQEGMTPTAFGMVDEYFSHESTDIVPVYRFGIGLRRLSYKAKIRKK
ncbi:MAG: hypothetical protein AAGH79_10395 [Bacteroidota bacterium]